MRGGGASRPARGAPPNGYAAPSDPRDHHRISTPRVAAPPTVPRVVARLVVVGAFALTPLSHATAQRARAPADSAARTIAACDSIIAASRAGDARLTVSAYLTRADGESLADSAADLLLLPILTQLELPTPLRLPVFAPPPTRMRAFRPTTADGGAALRSPALNAVYQFTLRRDGSIHDPRVRLAALAPGVDSAVVHALEVAGSLGVLGPERRDLVPRGGLDLLLRLAAGVAVPGHGRPLFNSTAGLFALVDATPPDTLPTPEYPRAEEEAGWEGRVLLQFAVDRDGRPAMSTVELLQASSVGFARAALDVLPSVRFRPARVGACAVWQLVRLPFEFRLPDDGG